MGAAVLGKRVKVSMASKILHFSIISLALFIFCFLGCSKKQPNPQELQVSQQATEANDKMSEYNKRLFASANLSPDRSEYLLGPGDLLEIKVFEAEKLNTAVRLSSRGEVSLPLLGEITLKGLTASEAEQLIEDEYQATYIKNPHVSIFVKEHYSQRVTVVGQVKNPGTYDYPSKQRLLDAIALAGGLTEKAGQNIQIRRLESVSYGTDQTLLVNLDKLVNEGKTELNIYINGGDVIFVPEAGSFYVDGAVRRPGEYHIKKTLSVNEAVLAAGGCEPYADTEEIVLMRKKKDGKREAIEINLKKATENARDIVIHDQDIIFVQSSFWGSLFHGTGLNIGIPGFGVNYRNPE